MHIAFLNPQGNFDKNDSYWTMHPDFGGQLVYVKELATQMAKLGHKVDIITRKIVDSNYPEFKNNFDYYPNISNLRIIRISCGPNNFLNKELLWDYLNEWTNNIIDFYKNEGSIFDFVTGHYGDGGLSCAMIKAKTGIPYSFTGHSLGAQKFDKLNDNLLSFEKIDSQYHFTERILAERTAIKYSDLIFVSTLQEKNEQYTHIFYEDILEENSPHFVISPPGANINVFAPYWIKKINENIKDKIDRVTKRDISKNRQNLPFIILASRLDHKKNHIGLVKAYSENKILQNRANILISLRGIENAYLDYSTLNDDETDIINTIMGIIKEKNLYGKVMFVDINSQSQLADMYRYTAKKHSVFVLTAFYEPFGLAPIEAMSAGLPAAVTKYGGPSEILQDGDEQFGVLLDVYDNHKIAEGINNLFDNYEYYQSQGNKRVLSKYTWEVTAKTYVNAIEKNINTSQRKVIKIPRYFITHNRNDLNVNLIKNKVINIGGNND